MDLTEVERRLVSHVAFGTVLDLAPLTADDDIDGNVMRSWGTPHKIRAEVVRDILRGRHLPDDGPDPHGLRLRGAWIVGRIDLEGITTTIPLQLVSCFLPDGMDGRGCVLPHLRLDRSVITSSGEDREQGAVHLSGAHITGRLVMSDATLTNDAGPAVNAEMATIGGGAFLDGTFTASGHGGRGAVHLSGAHITGRLVMSDATLTNDAGPAMTAEMATIGGGAFLNGTFTARGHGEPGGVRLSGAHIIGPLVMGDATLTNDTGPALHAERVIVDHDSYLDGTFTANGHGRRGAVCLPGAHINGELVMSGATLTNETGPALHAVGMTVDAGAFLNGRFTANGHGKQGAVRLARAHITGQLVMHNATLKNEAGPALHAVGMTVDAGALLNGTFTANGQDEQGAVLLSMARFSRRLVMGDATLTNETGPALYADGMTVDGGAFLDSAFTANGHGEHGAVRLTGTHIAGPLVMSGATLTNDTGPALHADGMSVGAGAFLNRRFTANGHGTQGAVRLPGARIAAELVLSGATLTNEAGPALDARSVTVAGAALLDATFTGGGRSQLAAVRLEGTHITGQMVVDAASIDRACNGATWTVDGLTYDGFPSAGFERWLRLLRSGTPGYRPQPYRQLAAAARAAGHDREARRALIAQRDDQGERGDLSRPARAWARFTKTTLGYGYQPWRALVGVAIVLIAAVIVVFLTPCALAHTPRSTPCTAAETFQIAVDMAIPLVSTSAGTLCHITATPGGQFVAWASVFLTFSGWALTALFAAGFTRAIRQP